jgi:hypothetical protein
MKALNIIVTAFLSAQLVAYAAEPTALPTLQRSSPRCTADLVDGKGTNQRELISFKPAGTPEKLSREERQKLMDKVGVPDGFVFDEFGRLYLGMWTGKVVNVIAVHRGGRWPQAGWIEVAVHRRLRASQPGQEARVASN